MNNHDSQSDDPTESDDENSVSEVSASTESKTDAVEQPQKRFGKGAILFVISLGVLAGIGTFTFGYGKGASYLSNNPESCVNCHVMQDHMDSWQQSSHHHVAVCNDCHLPHDFVGKMVTKADNGFFHSVAFTFGGYKDPIQIKPRNRIVTQNACIDCHKDFVHPLLPGNDQDDMQLCIHCHKGVGHAGR